MTLRKAPKLSFSTLAALGSPGSSWVVFVPYQRPTSQTRSSCRTHQPEVLGGYIERKTQITHSRTDNISNPHTFPLHLPSHSIPLLGQPFSCFLLFTSITSENSPCGREQFSTRSGWASLSKDLAGDGEGSLTPSCHVSLGNNYNYLASVL